MRLILLVLSLIVLQNSFGQSKQLIIVDSSNFVIINDSLIDKYKAYSDSNMRFTFYTEKIKNCPCNNGEDKGMISFKSSSFLIKENTCFYIYQVIQDYFIHVGKMTKYKDEKGKHVWKFKTKSINEVNALELIEKYKTTIQNSEIPKYDSWDNYPLVMDGISYTFGDIDSNSFSTTPRWDYSESVKEIIKISNKLIKRTFR
ncbi:MAG TPA: hypothetical protein VIN10_02250 [Bacteroidales bacterium]